MAPPGTLGRAFGPTGLLVNLTLRKITSPRGLGIQVTTHRLGLRVPADQPQAMDLLLREFLLRLPDVS